MQGVFIVLLAIAAAVGYGIAHDLITTQICVEYFTVWHPPVWGGIKDPILLALTWGVIATWWVGTILGIPLALAARMGSLPKRSAASLLKPIGVLLVCMAVCATGAGLFEYFQTSGRGGALFDPIESGIPASRQVRAMVDAYTHLASYASGFLGGLILIIWVLVKRYQAKVAELRAQRL